MLRAFRQPLLRPSSALITPCALCCGPLIEPILLLFIEPFLLLIDFYDFFDLFFEAFLLLIDFFEPFLLLLPFEPFLLLIGSFIFRVLIVCNDLFFCLFDLFFVFSTFSSTFSSSSSSVRVLSVLFLLFDLDLLRLAPARPQTHSFWHMHERAIATKTLLAPGSSFLCRLCAS